MTAINNPSEFVLFSDSNGSIMAAADNEDDDFIHSKYANYAFSDGHVSKHQDNDSAVSFTKD